MTTDVIAPIVDDPETFGEIAAINALSDIYAMGGTPLYALNLAFFPDEKLPLTVLSAILEGGARACQRLGVEIIGGHTVRNDDIKYGLAVTGEVDKQHILDNRGAQAGNRLLLTKPLGTGILGTAIRRQVASDVQIAAAIESMTTSNDRALAIARQHNVSACTDVTGFGLLGHLENILLGSSLAARLSMKALPSLPGAFDHARNGHIPGGSNANREHLEKMLRYEGVADPLRITLATDAQTSGGLLLCVPSDRCAALTADLRAASVPAHDLGELIAPSGTEPVGTITLCFE